MKQHTLSALHDSVDAPCARTVCSPVIIRPCEALKKQMIGSYPGRRVGSWAGWQLHQAALDWLGCCSKPDARPAAYILNDAGSSSPAEST